VAIYWKLLFYATQLLPGNDLDNATAN